MTAGGRMPTTGCQNPRVCVPGLRDCRPGTRNHDGSVPFTLKRITRGQRSYYHLAFDCPCTGQRRITFRPPDGERDNAYLARVELMHGWSKADPEWKAVDEAHPAKVENSSMQRDKRLPFKRIPAYDHQAQHAQQTHEEFGTALLALSDHRKAVNAGAPPGEQPLADAA